MSSVSETRFSSFQADALSAIASVRVALSALTQTIDGPMLRPTDLQKTLGIDSKLSWQVYNIVNQGDPLAAAKMVPGEPSLNRLIRAAHARGVPQHFTDAVREAIAEFNRVVEVHAEDRAEFDFMASSVSSVAAATAAELAFRRQAFRAESNIWGVCTDVTCLTTIVRLGASENSTDECTIVSKRGCRRLRPDAPKTVFAYRNYGANGAPAERTRVALDAAAAERYGAHILPRFCSQPIPAFRTWKRPDGYNSVDIQSDEIGRRSAVDVTLGHIFRNCPLVRGLAGEPVFQCDSRAVTPTRMIISVMLVHRPSLGTVRPTLSCFRNTPGDVDPAIAISAPQLPVREELRVTGVGKLAWHTPDLVGHDLIVQSAFDELGWNPAEFDTFQLRIECPALHSVTRMQFSV